MSILNETMGQLKDIHAKIQKARKAIKKMNDSEEEDEAMEEDETMEEDEAMEEDETMEDGMMEKLRNLYDERSKIIKTIPCFWLIAFLGHHALGILLSEEDQKIFGYLTSVTVTVEVREGSPSGYTITLNFAVNPYFHDENLIKKIPYSSTGGEIWASTINWKDTAATTGNQQESLEKGEKLGYTDADISFFAWFSVCDALEGTPDEVANLITDDLWPNAVEYFTNGNFTDAEENAIDEDCQLLCIKDKEINRV